MKKNLALLMLALLPFLVNAQSYDDDLLLWREAYKLSLTTGSHALKPADTAFLRFYAPDADYKVKATFVPVKGAKPFFITNMRGAASKIVREYGYVSFDLMGVSLKLHVYQFIKEENIPQGNNQLFIPFTDHTNNKETFQGGRYLDIPVSSIKYNEVVLDFNKCYNPHAAYEKGYTNVIPPRENNLRIEINAGEKRFGDDRVF